MMKWDNQIVEAVYHLKKGDVIAYPTEAVYGFGCDPYNAEAVTRILQLKSRSFKKGFILVGANWEQLEPLVDSVSPNQLAQVLATWPGPVTWVFPAKPEVPTWITGEARSIAVRVSDHPIVHDLCEAFGGPIVSTSANYHDQPPTRDYRTTKMIFGDQLGYVIKAPTGGRSKPSAIRDVLTGEFYREG